MSKQPTTSFASGRLAALDVLRGIAILMVLGRHILTIDHSLPRIVYYFFDLWQQIGWAGVDLFFVLSGYLVSGLLFKEFQRRHKVDGIRFLIRRGFKIYPAFYFMLAVSTVASLCLNLYPNFDLRKFAHEIVFIQNYLPGLFPHTWSLAVEEHFYLLVVLFISALCAMPSTASSFNRLPAVITALLVIILSERVLYAQHFPPGEWLATLCFTHFRLDSLLFGVLISCCAHFHAPATIAFVERFKLLLLANSIVLLSPLFLFPLEGSRIMYTWGFTTTYLGFGIILLVMIVSDLRGRLDLSNKFTTLQLIGRHSYSIYLWHIPMYFWSKSLLRYLCGSSINFYLHTALYCGGSIVLGALLSIKVERPFLNLRERWFPAR